MLAEVFGELLVGEEMFAVAVAAVGVGMVLSDAFPEEQGDVAILLLAGQFIFAGQADDLGELRVGVVPLEVVFLF